MSTRVVGGVAGGRRLAVPSRGTRPTGERAREALFNSLGDLTGLRVLDLFAGSGAVGLEALSRGAALAVLVDSGRAAAPVIEANIAAVGLPGARLDRRTVRSFLSEPSPDTPADTPAYAPAGSRSERFDIVFADPPYDLPAEELDALLDLLPPWLEPGADVVVERSVRGRGPQWPDVIEATRSRRYGEAVLWYGRLR